MANLLPAKTKYRKVHKGRNRHSVKGGGELAFGDFGIQSLERGLMSASQLEAARVAINRHLKRKGKVWMRVFPQKPVTKKPAETRMGKGKGAVEFWAVVVRPGNVLFEISGVPMVIAREAMRLADGKVPFGCRFIAREEMEQFVK
jgi:large subunit ribosomal protein L16